MKILIIKVASRAQRAMDPDAPPVPPGLQPRDGVEYGCGDPACADCYEIETGPWDRADYDDENADRDHQEGRE